MRRALAGSITVLTLWGCTFVRPLEYLNSEQGEAGTSRPSDGGVRDGGARADAGTDAPAGACTPGTRIEPFAFFEYIDPNAGEAPQAVTCNLENVLKEDGNLAMLDRKTNGAIGKGFLAQKEVAGCVGVEFKEPIEKLVARFGVVGDGCGISPCIPGTGCETTQGFQAHVFAGQTRDSLKFVEQQRFGVNTLESYVYAAPVIDTRFVVVCRHGNVGVERDDIGVDAIWGECP